MNTGSSDVTIIVLQLHRNPARGRRGGEEGEGTRSLRAHRSVVGRGAKQSRGGGIGITDSRL